MLNTDQHSSQIKVKMDKSAFIKNNKGINDNGDLPDAFLSEIFDEISNNEIIMEDEHTSKITQSLIGSSSNEEKKMELYNLEVAQIHKKSHQMIKSAMKSPFTPATQKELAKPMFTLVSWPMMAVFSFLFEAALDEIEGTSDPKLMCDPLIVQVI